MSNKNLKAYVGAVGATKLTAILVMACILGVLLLSVGNTVAQATGYVYTTDAEGISKLDFAPGDYVYIHGTHFDPTSPVTISLTRPGGSVEYCGTDYCDTSSDFGGDAYTGFNGLQTSDEEGDFIYIYDLDGITGEYSISVTTDGANFITTTFTDARTINWAKLNGASAVTVPPSTKITASVNVTTTGQSQENDWESTRYAIGVGSWQCNDTADHTSSGTNVESFIITAPATPGVYNVTFRAYDGDNCDGSNPSGNYTLKNGIIVENPQPFCGDGIINGNDVCDDGNTANGDGCNSTCGVEQGWSCTSTSPSVCTVINPTLGQSCGIDMVLVIDSSGSIDDTELGQMKTAFKGFVDAFLPNTPTQIAVVEFDTTAHTVYTYSNNNVTVKSEIDAASSGGYTNWQDALNKTKTMIGTGSDKPDLVVFASDGNPNTVWANGTYMGDGVAAVLQAAVVQANAIKLGGARIITLGIGSDVIPANLKAISSADAYYNTTSFATLAQTLADLADDLCGGTVIVKKLVDGNAAGGWHFTTSVTNGTSTPPEGNTAQDGFIVFDIEGNGGTAIVDVTENVQPGYNFVSASCRNEAGAPVGTPGTGTVTGIPVGPHDTINCEFNNHLSNCSEYGETECAEHPDECAWCPECSGFRINEYGAGMCYDKATCDCTYPDCSKRCDAQCAVDADCIVYTGGTCNTNTCQCEYPSHTVCRDMTCVSIPGSGTNECSADGDCYYYGCESMSCVQKPGTGTDLCASDDNCIDKVCRGLACVTIPGTGQLYCNEDTDCYYNDCDYGQLACLAKEGTASDECTNFADCPQHKVCDYQLQACKIVEGAGTDQCSTYDDCFHKECLSGYCTDVPNQYPGQADQCTSDGQCRHNVCDYGQLVCREDMTPGTSQCDIGEFVPDCAECVSDADCDDGVYCNGTETCVNLHCVPGTPVSCSQYNILGIATCDNNPDNISYTWDYRLGFTSQCVNDAPNQGHCTRGNDTITHTCDTVDCGAECEDDNDCQNKCVGNFFYSLGECLEDCVCDYLQTDCNDGIACTIDSCDAATGCSHTPDNSLCDDQDPCTQNICDINKGCIYPHSDPTGPITDIVIITPDPTCGKISFNATITDNCTNIADGIYAIDACPIPGYGGYQVLPLDDGSYDGDKMQELVGVVDLSILGFNDGRHTLYVRGKNTDGTWGSCDAYGFEIDTLPPRTESQNITPLMACGSDPYLTARICDPFDQSGVCGAEYYIDDFTQGDGLGIEMFPVDGEWGDECEDVYAWVNISLVSEGTHYIKAHGVDCTGCNWGKIKHLNPVWFIKDTVAPTSVKTVGTPKIECDYDNEECWFITQSTKITMIAQDSNPGDGEYSGNPSIPEYPEYNGFVDIYYRQRWKENYDSVWGPWSSWTLYTGPFNFTEDSLHEIEYYSTDACGNNEISKYEIDIVDTKKPETAKDVSAPKVAGDGNPIHYYITKDSTIKLNCTDPQPHPVDQVTLNWAVYYSENCVEPSWALIGSGNEEGGYKEITNLGDSCHKIVYSCVDALGNTETEHVEIDAVDNKAPVVNKQVGEPKVPFVPVGYLIEYSDVYDIEDPAWYINQSTPITLTCADQLPHPVDDVKIYYKYYNDGELIQDWALYTGPFTYPQDTYHELYYYCIDKLGNKGPTHVEYDVVDTLPPVSQKSVGLPKQQVDCSTTGEGSFTDGCYYINQSTPITLSCSDGGPHPVDNVKIFYKTDWKNDSMDSWQLGSWIEDSSQVTFYYGSDSYHRLTWYCIDALGNKETDHTELDIVDTQKPQTVKTIIGPQFDGQNGIHKYITKNTVIDLTCTDPQPHPVDHVTLNWQLYWSESCVEPDWDIIGSGSETDGNVQLTNFDDSCHRLVYYCADALGNTENTQIEIDAVDNKPPVGTKVVGDPNVPCVGEGECTQFDYWVRDHVTPVTLDCTDAQPHPIGGEVMCYQIKFDDEVTPDLTQQYCTLFGGNMNNGWCCAGVDGSKNYVLNFTEDSVHTLEYYCKDAFNNQNAKDLETFKVDSVPPTTTKTYEGPFYTNGVSDWIDTISTVKLTATDGGAICAVGGMTTYYAVTPVGDSYCYDPAANCQQMHTYNDQVWSTYNGEFSIAESCHLIEFYSVDALGNKEAIKHQCVFSDHTPPVTIKTYGTPIYPAEGYPKWITSATPITLTAADQAPHPSGVKETKYRVTLVGDLNCYEACNAEGSGNYQTYTAPFTIAEDSCHLIEYYSVDNVDKTETTKRQCVFVDNKPPVSTKTFDGFKVPCSELPCKSAGDCEYYINKDTRIILTCNDQIPHPVDNVKIYYRYKVDVGEWTPWTQYTVPIQYNEDSKHTLEWYCVDALGNTEETHSQVERVDTTPPTTVKTFSGPTYPLDEANPNYWVTSDTAITLTATDGGAICAAGSSKLYYTVKWDKNCDGDFNDFGEVVINNAHVHVNETTCKLEKTLYLNGECLHEITWHAVDALGNVETEHVQQHKVDNTPPHILILKPVDGWYSKGEDIPAIAEVKDLNNADGPCESHGQNCNELGTNCSVGIEDGAQCYAFLVNLEFLNMNPMEIFDLSDVVKYDLDTEGTLLYNANARECQGYATIPEDSDVQSGIHIFVVGAEDNLGNEANSIDEIRLAIDQACGGGCWSSDPYDLCEPQCVDDVLQDIITTWNLPKIGIDTDAPEVTITAPVPEEGTHVDKGQLFVSADVTESGITCAITSGTPCYVKIDGTTIGTFYYNNTNRKCEGTLVVPEDVPNGISVPFTVEVSDNCGNIGKGVVYLTVDTMNPTPVILTSQDVENPPYDTDSQYDLVWTGGDDANFKQFDIVIDGTTYYDVTQPYEGLTAEGKHTYKVIASDKVGKIATSNEVVVWVDTVDPVVDVTGSTPGIGFFLFTYTVTDANPSSGMQPLQVIGGFGGICSQTLPTGFCMVVGTTSATLKACDNAGNCGSDTTDGTEIDVTPPMIVESSPSGVIDYSIVELFVETSEPSTCYYSNQDVLSGMDEMITSDNIDHTANLGYLNDGLYVYHVQCKDFAGNYMDHSKTIVFFVNTAGDYCYTADLGLGDSSTGWKTFFLPQLILDDINFNCGETPYETADVLSSIEGKYEKIYYYNGTDWLSYKPGRPINDLKEFNDELSNPYYIKLTEPARLGLQCEDECVSNYCGDGQVNGEEQCELPDDNNNEYCPQTTQQCYQDTHKTQYRDAYGYCDESCGCMEDQEWGSAQCVFDECGAQCAVDEDCNQGYYCNGNCMCDD